MNNYFKFTGIKFSILHLLVLSAAIIGAFFISWSIPWVLATVFFFYLFNSVGMSMMMHRYWTHRAFEFKSTILKNICTFIAIISTRGSPLAWVHIHRTHHAYSDTDKDPHKLRKFSLLSFKNAYIKEFKVFLVRDLMTDTHKFIHEYYFLFTIVWVVLLLLINPYLLYFTWILPVSLNQMSQDLWNYYSHTDSGYRNFETKDKSRNVPWLWFIVSGEAWHNNHHHNPGALSFKVKPHELDPMGALINIIKK